MPRQDVPYGGVICRLKERIAEIWDKLGEKLHTINGVPGDGDGNVKIVSGSSAVVINNDPTQNEIAVSLDTSQLPAASVSSVNGQTGAVALDAGDIPSDGNSDVQSDIDALQTMDGALQGNINAEALARQNADSALQTNINNITASIPSQVVAAVAADPTIAHLVSADSDNVKLTGNQAIGGIKTVSTEATGTYSQQIANSQKVRNEIANLAVMQTGNQNISGIKTFTTANGILLNTNSGYNLLTIKASGSAIGIDFNDKSNDINGASTDRRIMSYRHFYGGGSYDTYWIECKPRNPIIDKDTVTASGGIEIVVGNNNNVEFNLFGYKTDGTVSRHRIAKFDGTNWS